MERYSSGRNVAITGQLSRDRGLVVLIIIAIVILIIVIVLIILVRSSIPSTNTTSGSGSSACVTDADCNSAQVCDTSRGRCVDCVTSPDCPDTAPLCDTVTQKCVNCITSTDCPVSAPKCLSPKQICVNCITDPDCGGATPFCNTVTHNCAGCITDSQCPSNAPLCNPSNNFCVSCINSSQCVAPATCVSGRCCDLTPPSVHSAGITYTYSSGGAVALTLSGDYISNLSDQPGVVAALQTYDSTGFLLFTSSSFPADGTYSIEEGGYPRYYYGYTYQIAIRLSTPCGVTAYSPLFPVNVPLPTNGVIPVIASAIARVGSSNSSITVQLSTPNCTDHSFFPIFYYTTTPGLDPNRMTVQPTTFVSNTCDSGTGNIQASSNWLDHGASEVPGETIYLIVVDTNSLIYIPSAQFAITVAPLIQG